MRCAYAEPYTSPAGAAPKKPRAPAIKLTPEEKEAKKLLTAQKKAETEKKKAWKETLVEWGRNLDYRLATNTLVGCCLI